MSSAFVRRIKAEIARAGEVYSSVIAEIDEELEREPSAELWILRGDAIQLCEDEDVDVEEAEASYLQALRLDPSSADAYESLGHFTFSMHDDAPASLEYFRKAIELGAGASARDGLREAEQEISDNETA